MVIANTDKVTNYITEVISNYLYFVPKKDIRNLEQILMSDMLEKVKKPGGQSCPLIFDNFSSRRKEEKSKEH